MKRIVLAIVLAIVNTHAWAQVQLGKGVEIGFGSNTAGVASFGPSGSPRTGAVVPIAGDYSFSLISGNLGTGQGPSSLTGLLQDTAGTLSAATSAQIATQLSSTPQTVTVATLNGNTSVITPSASVLTSSASGDLVKFDNSTGHLADTGILAASLVGLGNANNFTLLNTFVGGIQAATATHATSGANQNSPEVAWASQFWDGSTSQVYTVAAMLEPGSGTNPGMAINFSATSSGGSPGVLEFQFPGQAYFNTMGATGTLINDLRANSAIMDFCGSCTPAGARLFAAGPNTTTIGNFQVWGVSSDASQVDRYITCTNSGVGVCTFLGVNSPGYSVSGTAGVTKTCTVLPTVAGGIITSC
ncbi:MAG: hypothetical protein ACRELE_12625 [Gemmatimonadales bacterium]